MTTGRINQVAIMSPPVRNARERGPKRLDSTQCAGHIRVTFLLADIDGATQIRCLTLLAGTHNTRRKKS